MAEVGIEKIVIKIGTKEVELSLAEARELHQILDDTFGAKRVTTIPYPVPQPYPVPAWPWPRITWSTTNWSVEYNAASRAMLLTAGPTA